MEEAIEMVRASRNRRSREDEDLTRRPISVPVVQEYAPLPGPPSRLSKTRNRFPAKSSSSSSSSSSSDPQSLSSSASSPGGLAKRSRHAGFPDGVSAKLEVRCSDISPPSLLYMITFAGCHHPPSTHLWRSPWRASVSVRGPWSISSFLPRSSDSSKQLSLSIPSPTARIVCGCAISTRIAGRPGAPFGLLLASPNSSSPSSRTPDGQMP
mmetsp:Transcript_219/g.497  ORF Transcript_219/g.497 Transcript_219/m.497 type:complete len:210 (-) Transcript_219:410-1039(-)